jgi:hypothetical protein
MKALRNSALALATSMLFAVPASAALINYSEAINGDLSNGNPLSLFVLDTAGVNTISGNIGLSAPSGTCPTANQTNFDCDSFALTVLAGLEIVGLSVALSNTGATPLEWRVGTGLLDFAGTPIGNLINTAALSGGALPLGPGSYNVSWVRIPTSTAATGIDYTFSITTRQTQSQSIPEPSTLAVVGVGLIGLALSRRRRG